MQQNHPQWIATLKAEINNYSALPDNWDGYGAKTPFPWSVSDSISFLDKAPANFPQANAMLSPEGFIELYWDNGTTYVDISFDDNGIASVYQKVKGGCASFSDGCLVAKFDDAWFDKLRVWIQQ